MNISALNNTGRFSIGQEIFVAIIVHNVYRDGRYVKEEYPDFFLVGHQIPVTPVDVKFRKLTVKSHHKVAWEYDEEKELKYDGYQLYDEEGNIYHNQFPTASYGQLSDSSNHRFCPIEDADKRKALFGFFSVEKLLENNRISKDRNPREFSEHEQKFIYRSQTNRAFILSAFQRDFGKTHEIFNEVIYEGVGRDGKPYKITRDAIRKKGN